MKLNVLNTKIKFKYHQKSNITNKACSVQRWLASLAFFSSFYEIFILIFRHEPYMKTISASLARNDVCRIQIFFNLLIKILKYVKFLFYSF